MTHNEHTRASAPTPGLQRLYFFVYVQTCREPRPSIARIRCAIFATNLAELALTSPVVFWSTDVSNTVLVHPLLPFPGSKFIPAIRKIVFVMETGPLSDWHGATCDSQTRHDDLISLRSYRFGTSVAATFGLCRIDVLGGKFASLSTTWCSGHWLLKCGCTFPQLGSLIALAALPPTAGTHKGADTDRAHALIGGVGDIVLVRQEPRSGRRQCFARARRR